MLIVVCNDLSPAVLPCIDFLSPLFWIIAAAAELLTLPPGGLATAMVPPGAFATEVGPVLGATSSPAPGPPGAVALSALLIFIFNMFV